MPPWEELESLNHADLQGLDDAIRSAIRERATPQPFGTYTRPSGCRNPERTKLPTS
jgi:hypothetical protein